MVSGVVNWEYYAVSHLMILEHHYTFFGMLLMLLNASSVTGKILNI